MASSETVAETEHLGSNSNNQSCDCDSNDCHFLKYCKNESTKSTRAKMVGTYSFYLLMACMLAGLGWLLCSKLMVKLQVTQVDLVDQRQTWILNYQNARIADALEAEQEIKAILTNVDHVPMYFTYTLPTNADASGCYKDQRVYLHLDYIWYFTESIVIHEYIHAYDYEIHGNTILKEWEVEFITHKICDILGYTWMYGDGKYDYRGRDTTRALEVLNGISL